MLYRALRIKTQERRPCISTTGEQGSPQLIYIVCRPAAVQEPISAATYLSEQSLQDGKWLMLGKNVHKAASQGLGTGRSLFLAH